MIDIANLPDNTPGNWLPVDHASKSLNIEEMTHNAAMFTMYFAFDLDAKTDLEWTPEAVSAMLGNISVESTINPWRWENDTSNTGGYGLVQWTPYTEYSDFITTGVLHGFDTGHGGYLPETWGTWDGDNAGYLETETIATERKYNLQWIPTEKYNFTFQEFTRMRESTDFMTEAFLLDYERPADPAASLKQRQTWADYWYWEVVLPIYGMGTNLWYYYLWGYIFNRNYKGVFNVTNLLP